MILAVAVCDVIGRAIMPIMHFWRYTHPESRSHSIHLTLKNIGPFRGMLVVRMLKKMANNFFTLLFNSLFYTLIMYYYLIYDTDNNLYGNFSTFVFFFYM